MEPRLQDNFFVRILLFSLPILNSPAVFGEVQICEIKYDENYVIQTKNKPEVPLLQDNPRKKHCYQIGIEFDKFKQPVKDQPIFACCLPEKSR